MTSARPDTRYLATSPIATDLSQRVTNLIASAPGGYELMSARTAISGSGPGRTIELTVPLTNASTGVAVDHGLGGYRISVSAGSVVFSDSSGTLATIVPPSIGGAARSYLVAWATEGNPGPLAATHRSCMLVYDVASATLAKTVVFHSESAPSPAATFTVGGIWTGSMTQTLAGITAVRVSCRFHTPAETREHFVAATAAPSATGPLAVQMIPIPSQTLEAGRLAGSGYQMAAASMATTRDRHRLLSPVWQWANTDTSFDFADDMRDTLRPSHVLDLDLGYQTPISWLARRRIPRHASWVYAKIQVSTWELAPGTTDPVDFRLTCADGPPQSFTEARHSVVTRTVDDGGGPGLGELLTFDDGLEVVRGLDGFSWLWLSARTDGGSGSGNAGYQVRGLAVTPLVLDGVANIPVNPWGP